MNNEDTFEWAVVGAGPAGIAAVGKLIDNQVDPKKILWVDPVFQTGDFGTRWKKVSSNTRVKLFLKYLMASGAFQYDLLSKEFALNQLDPDKTCELSIAAEPLQWITDNLRREVTSLVDKAIHLKLTQRHWEVTFEKNDKLYAKNVILAMGAEPKSLSFPFIEEVGLETALHPEKLASAVSSNDTIAVFGSSHSAIIIIRTLLENCSVKKVINFYRDPLRYAVIFPDWILFDDTGLKGTTAQWARENIDGQLPDKLERVISNESNLKEILPTCQKAIYAVGFEKRQIIVEGMTSLKYNEQSGIIAPGLFGLGIGFPESKADPFGTIEYRVGLWKFMEYLHRVMPVWLRYGT